MKAHRLSASDPSDRIMNLEMAVAHLEYELDQMNSVLLAVQAELKAACEQVSKLERRMVLVQPADEIRDPVDDRPPHY